MTSDKIAMNNLFGNFKHEKMYDDVLCALGVKVDNGTCWDDHGDGHNPVPSRPSPDTPR